MQEILYVQFMHGNSSRWAISFSFRKSIVKDFLNEYTELLFMSFNMSNSYHNHAL